jgi:hypothetical protein
VSNPFTVPPYNPDEVAGKLRARVAALAAEATALRADRDRWRAQFIISTAAFLLVAAVLLITWVTS